MVKNPLAIQETQVRSLSWEDPLEKEMAVHSNLLARRIPRTKELGGLQTMESVIVGKRSDIPETAEAACLSSNL